MAEVVLRATGVVKEYRTGKGVTVRALRGVSLVLSEGTTLGIVGESGCGKSTLARLLVGLELPTSGRVEVMGEPAGAGRRRSMAGEIQLVFQDPFSSLNPRLTVSAALNEVLAVHQLAGDRAGRRGRVDELLAMVALGPASRSVTHTNCPEARRSASPLPVPSPWGRGCWCSMSPHRRSTCRYEPK